MEIFTRTVRDISSADKVALEHVIGKQLGDRQKIMIQVINIDRPMELATSEPISSSKLPAWRHVYDGLTDQQIGELEGVILQRADLGRVIN